MTNEELVLEIQQGIDVRMNMGILYERNMKLIRIIVQPFSHQVEISDLMQEAYFGLCKAVESYEAEQDCKFMSYATYKIRSSCIRYMIANNSNIRIPDGVYWMIAKYNKYVFEYKKKCFCDPSDKEIMNELKIDKEQFKNLKKFIKKANTISIYSDSVNADGDSYSLIDSIADEENIEESVLDEITDAELWECLDYLSGKQKDIVESHYKKGITVEQIASELNVSRSWVYEIERKALNTLKRLDRVKELGDLYGYDCNIAYHIPLTMCLNYNTSPTEHLAMKRIESEEKMKKAVQYYEEVFEGLGDMSTDDIFNSIMSMK